MYIYTHIQIFVFIYIYIYIHLIYIHLCVFTYVCTGALLLSPNSTLSVSCHTHIKGVHMCASLDSVFEKKLAILFSLPLLLSLSSFSVLLNSVRLGFLLPCHKYMHTHTCIYMIIFKSKFHMQEQTFNI